MPLNAKEAELLIDAIKSLLEHPAGGTKRDKRPIEKGNVVEAPVGKALTLDRPVLEGTDSVGDHVQPFADVELEKLYQAFKSRLIEEAAIDPVLLHLLTTRPEIVVEVERRKVTVDGSSLKGRVARVIASGFLKDSPRTSADIRREMMKTGGDVHSGNLSRTMADLRDDGLIIDTGSGWALAAGVKITEQSIESKG